MGHRVFKRLLFVAMFGGLVTLFADSVGISNGSLAQSPSHRCDIAFPLPNPSEIGVKKFEKQLYAFLEEGCYKKWTSDSQIRNTGPFISGLPFGTHDAVKVYYSPAIWEWLKVRNRQGEIADGAMTVKEMYALPAEQDAILTGWTAMVKDKKGSFD